MATVHVFVGQCGNQLGSAFLDSLATEAESSASEEYQMMVSATHFRPALKRRSSRASGLLPGTSGLLTQKGAGSTNTSATTTPRRTLSSGGLQTRSYYTLTTQSAEGVDYLPQPRCVLVDMEPKVIEQTIQRTNSRFTRQGCEAGATSARQRAEQRLYPEEQTSPQRRKPFYCLAPQQCVTRGEGSGNNWAYGYYEQGESRRDAIAECLRRESELRDTTVSTYHVVHSVAGGTGSGVGCLVAEVVKDLYPHRTLLHSLVWPFECGEVVTQWYNVVMAMSTLRDSIDGAFIAFNDAIGAELLGVKANRGLRDAGEVSFDGLNERISELLTPLHLPQLLYRVPPPRLDTAKNRILGTPLPDPQHFDPLRYARTEDVMEALTLDPATKFFTGVNVPRLATGSTTWPAVLGEAARSARELFTTRNAFAGGSTNRVAGGSGEWGLSTAPFASTPRSCLWALRGLSGRTDGLRELQHAMATSPDAPFPLSSLFLCPADGVRRREPKGSSSRRRVDHQVSLYGPSPAIGEHFSTALLNAESLLQVGAFLHHFERYGVGKADVQDAAAKLWDTVGAYNMV